MSKASRAEAVYDAIQVALGGLSPQRAEALLNNVLDYAGAALAAVQAEGKLPPEAVWPPAVLAGGEEA